MHILNPMKTLSVLVADDEEDIRLLLEQWLKPLGHAVACVGNATEAIKHLKRVRFDLIITDVLMPDGDGTKLIEAVKESQPAARILAISGGGRYMDSNDCLRIARGLGADTAILKPFVREKFLAAIGDAMAPREPAHA
jgi:two-component system chemotaxis response regulator CheY